MRLPILFFCDVFKLFDSKISRYIAYINEFVYKGDVLEFINFEEGRIRPVTPVAQNNGLDALSIDGNITLPNNQKGAYDYFIRDYQQNVRMILTEETHSGTNTCTMESPRASIEDGMFGQTGTNNEVEITRSPKPSGWSSNTSSSVSELSALKHKIGPNVLLKVMASDQITATSQYYYAAPVTNGVGNNLTSDILTTLIQNLLGSTIVNPLAKGNNTLIQNQLNGNTSFSNITAPDAGNSAGNAPKAYMTVMFFDERFNFISENSSSMRVSQAGDGAPPLALTNVKAPKNGYAYVYLSNESNQSVYFDNLVVNDNRGRIIEEDHYYAFGLKIAAISSKKLPDVNEGNIDNKNFYNDKELFDDADLNWYDYGFRNYDPQIGRFTQLDPLTDRYTELTPYQYGSNEPIANIDIDGLEAFKVIQGVTITIVVKHTSTILPIVGQSLLRLFTIGIKHLSNFTGGIPFTSEEGISSDQAKHVQYPDNPESIDKFLNMMGLFSKAKKNPFEVDLHDVTMLPEFAEKLFKLSTQTSKQNLNNSSRQKSSFKDQKVATLKDTIFTMYSLPSSKEFSSDTQEVNNKWIKYRLQNPHSTKKIKSYNLKTSISN